MNFGRPPAKSRAERKSWETRKAKTSSKKLIYKAQRQKCENRKSDELRSAKQNANPPLRASHLERNASFFRASACRSLIIQQTTSND
ncbi:hypothetical protein V9T40_000456 [Parthenolecanium corni]|uniref:Uncharacterized protein n=1 Tax=Parthenolecanium corni TaxID=536013 RepID=A0AAN9T9K1_9HEMI